MLRYNILMIVLGGMTFASVFPREVADAQTGPSLVYAEHACLEYNVPPFTASFEGCVERAARAFDRGEPDRAYTEARTIRDARQACQNNPKSADVDSCLLAEANRRSER